MNTPTQRDLTLAFLRHQDELRQFIVRQVECRDTAADLLQDVYVRIAGYGQDESIVNQRAFLYRVAGNLLVDHFRRKARRDQRDGGLVSDDMACPHPEPDRIMAARQQWDGFVRRLRTLPPRSRDVFLLCRLEGNSHGQIAQRLALSPRQIEHLLQQARKQLQDRD